MTELKPCPFCGSSSNCLDIQTHQGISKDYICVCCRSCKATGVIHSTEEEAITAWNTRTLQDREGLKEFLLPLLHRIALTWDGMYCDADGQKDIDLIMAEIEKRL
jgi:Lar family restriction alleviation protein